MSEREQASEGGEAVRFYLPPLVGKASGLTDDQLRVIKELADGEPLADAARESGIPRGEIEGWIAGDTRFRRVLDQLRRDEIEEGAQNLMLLRAPALKALRTLLESPSTPPDILGRLALAILDRTGQPIDLVEHWGDFPALSQTPASARRPPRTGAGG